jgi:hypothetical protein
MSQIIQYFTVICCAIHGCCLAAVQIVDPLRSAPLRDGQPELVFNHLYVVVNQATFQIMRDHPYFRNEFAAVDGGFPKFEGVDESTPSLYFRGEQTYLEIFGPNNQFNEPIGNVGLGFCVETVNGLDWVETRLETQPDIKLQRILHRWDFDTETPANWYHAVYRQFPSNRKFVWWFSEYHTDFFPALYPSGQLARHDISRRTFLSSQYDAQKELKNIVGCVLVVEPSAAATLTIRGSCRRL